MTNWAINSGLFDNFIGSFVLGASKDVAGMSKSKNVNPQIMRNIFQEGCG